MINQPLLMPLLAQVALTFAVWAAMLVMRVSESNRKRIHPQRLADRAAVDTLLPDSAAPSNNFRNLLELPVLFYIAVVLSVVLFLQDPLMVKLAWAFVALRAVHSLIHCTYNRVMHRFVAYLAGAFVLMLMWVRLAVFFFYGG